MKHDESGLDPRGVAVLLRQYEPPKKDGGSKIVLPDEVKKRAAMIDVKMEVVALGPNVWHDEPTPRAAVGEKVLVTSHAGFMVEGPRDGKQYRLVNDRDIFCAFED